MITVHKSTIYGTPGNAERVDIVHDAVQMLLDYAGCTLVSEESDWEDYYDAVVDAGGGVAYRMYLYVPSGAWRHRLTIYRGYLNGGEFVSLDSATSDSLYTPSGRVEDQFATLIVINGGALWHLQFKFWWSEGGSGNRYATMRSAKIVSGLTGAEMTTSKITSSGAGQYFSQNFPGNPSWDYIRISGADYQLRYVRKTNCENNVPMGKIMLFPSLLTLDAVDNGLGVPTVGDQMPYYMAIPSGTVLNPYTEFYVDGTRYVSLGNLAIRST